MYANNIMQIFNPIIHDHVNYVAFCNKEGCDIYLEAWGSSPKNEKLPLCRSKPVWVSFLSWT